MTVSAALAQAVAELFPDKSAVVRSAAPHSGSAAAGWSTMYADDREVGAAMEVFLDNTLSGLQGLEKSPLTRLGQAMQNVAPDWLSRPIKRQVCMRLHLHAVTGLLLTAGPAITVSKQLSVSPNAQCKA